jgi:hypothetical protein
MTRMDSDAEIHHVSRYSIPEVKRMQIKLVLTFQNRIDMGKPEVSLMAWLSLDDAFKLVLDDRRNQDFRHSIGSTLILESECCSSD